jgi:hypothetical protein
MSCVCHSDRQGRRRGVISQKTRKGGYCAGGNITVANRAAAAGLMGKASGVVSAERGGARISESHQI